MNWADWTIIAILAISSLISLKRGFIKEALSLVVWVAAVVLAVLFHESLAVLLVNAIDTPSLRELTAFVILFVLSLIVGGLLNYLISELVKITGLTGTDRLLGVIFGFARGLIVVMAILILVPQAIPINQDPWWRQSLLIPEFMAMEALARQLASDIFGLITRIF